VPGLDRRPWATVVKTFTFKRARIAVDLTYDLQTTACARRSVAAYSQFLRHGARVPSYSRRDLLLQGPTIYAARRRATEVENERT